MIQVHRQLGPGLLESTYESCLAEELLCSELGFRRQVPIAVHYRNATIDCGYRADFVIEGCLLIELKSVEALSSIHVAQVLTYLKLAELEVGLLVNFNALTIRSGLRRLTRRDRRGGARGQSAAR
ncbi:MAG: GxxExxY protein [Labilithrix sp.]|nr:GxxExxY protein [Labilithrix sp.]